MAPQPAPPPSGKSWIRYCIVGFVLLLNENIIVDLAHPIVHHLEFRTSKLFFSKWKLTLDFSLNVAIDYCFQWMLQLFYQFNFSKFQVQGEGVNTVSSGGMLKIGHGGHKYRGMINTIATISREEGPRSLYNGLVPGLQRQMAFCAVRIGAYDAIRDFYLRLFHHGAYTENCELMFYN